MSVVKSACCFSVGPERDFIGAHSSSSQVGMALRAYMLSTSSRQKDWACHRLMKSQSPIPVTNLLIFLICQIYALMGTILILITIKW